MPSVLRDPATGKAITRGNKAALDESCADHCCGGCWWPLVPCECDDRPHSGTDMYWPCAWVDQIGGEEEVGDILEFEDACYYIDRLAAVTQIPEGAVEFPEGEIGALTWYPSCDSTYEEGQEPEDPPTLIEEGCCDPCARVCEDMPDTLTIDVAGNVSLEQHFDDAAHGQPEVTCDSVINCDFSQAWPVTRTIDPCIWAVALADCDACNSLVCDCLYSECVHNSSNPEHEFTLESWGVAIDGCTAYGSAQLLRDCSDPADGHWRILAIVSMSTMPEADCPSNPTNDHGWALIHARKDGPSPLGSYTVLSISGPAAAMFTIDSVEVA